MQLAAVNHLRALSSLGVQSSGLFGDVKTANFVYLPPPKELSRTGGQNGSARASYSRPGPEPPFPSRGTSQPYSSFQQQNTPPTPLEESPSAAFARAPAEAPNAPEDRNFTSAKPPSLSSDFKESPVTNPMPGLPGSPRPKPGTPRPYDPTKQKSKVMEWLTPPPPPTELLQREHYKLSSTCTCTIYFGDMSKWSVDGKTDAVIAPANKRLNTGPAVNAVLFKAAGTRLLDVTQRLPDVAPQGIKAEVGDAISTRAFNLPVARVIHTVGPVYKKDESGSRISDPDLIKAYRTALDIARKENLTHLAFPPLSCRIYGYPYSDGAEVALKTLKENSEGFSQIDIVIRNIEGYEAFINEANKVLEPIREKKTIKLKMGSDSTVTEAASVVVPPEVLPPPSPPPITPQPSAAPSLSAPPPVSSPPPYGPPYAPASPAFETRPPPASPYGASSSPSPPLPPSPYGTSSSPSPLPPSTYGASPSPSPPPPVPYPYGASTPPRPPPLSPPYGAPPPAFGASPLPPPPYQQQPPPQYQSAGPRETWQTTPPSQPSWQNAPPPQQPWQSTPPLQRSWQNATTPQQPWQNAHPPQQPWQNTPPPQQSWQNTQQPWQNAPPSPAQNQYSQYPPPPPPSEHQNPPPAPPQNQPFPPHYQTQTPPPPPQQQEQNAPPHPQLEYQGDATQQQESSSFVPPRQRASSTPPSGPPPTPPSSPTMPFPKRYEYQ